MDNIDIYTEDLLDHCRYPRRYGAICNPTSCLENRNRFCGDNIKIYLKVVDQKVLDLGFECESCAIVKACASMLYSNIVGKTIDEINKINQVQILELLGKPNLNYARIKCALLPLTTLQLVCSSEIK